MEVRPTRLETFDIVVLKADRSVIGYVEKTHHDTSTHHALQECLIISHVPVPISVLEDFINSGIPPKGYLLLKFANEVYGSSLVAESDVVLLSRSLAIGDTVKQRADDAMVGTVVSVSNSYILEPVRLGLDTNSVDASADGGRNPALPPEIIHPRQRELLYDIPGHEIIKAQDFVEGDHIVYRGWVGLVERVDVAVVLLLENNAVVVVDRPWELEIVIPNFNKPLVALPDIDSLNRPEVPATSHNGWFTMPAEEYVRGQFVVTNHKNLQLGRWLRGRYDGRCKPQGWILDVRAGVIDVRWLSANLAPRRSSSQSATSPHPCVRPYENMNRFTDARDLRRVESLVVYDHEVYPSQMGNDSDSSVARGTGQDFRVGDHVKFRDQEGAAGKYQRRDNDQHGTLRVIPKESVFGFDMNEFKIVTFVQESTVMWQDQSVTTQRSALLEPIQLPEADLLPGDIVTAKEGMKQVLSDAGEEAAVTVDFNEMSFFEHQYDLRPEKVGVVQAVNSRERIAKVRWFVNPKIELLDYAHALSKESKFGALGDLIEDVSLYEIMSHPALMRRRRDFVNILPSSGPRTWLGHVVDIGIDGMVTVRLGALGDQCRDVRIPHDHILAALEQFDGILNETDDDVSMHSGYEEIEYEGGQRIDDDEGDEMWLTDSDEVVDSHPRLESISATIDAFLGEHISPPRGRKNTSPPTADDAQAPIAPFAENASSSGTERIAVLATNSQVPQISGIALLAGINHNEQPPRFAILDGIPPDDQFRKSEPPIRPSAMLIKRLFHEHSILESSLPENEIYVRTYESRLDLLRCLIVGPADTPYEYAPFVIDLHIGSSFPIEPPTAHFHSWTSGLGRINPNLYEEGKVCLSLLGTWPGKNTNEGWTESATLLQLLVSLQGLVFVKMPFYNEAGFETYAEDKAYTLESLQYSEKAFVMARGFAKHAIHSPVQGLTDVLSWLYLPGKENSKDTREGLLRKMVSRSQKLIERSEASKGSDDLVDGIGESTDSTKVFLRPLSQGAIVMLRKTIKTLTDMLQEWQELQGQGVQ